MYEVLSLLLTADALYLHFGLVAGELGLELLSPFNALEAFDEAFGFWDTVVDATRMLALGRF